MKNSTFVVPPFAVMMLSASLSAQPTEPSVPITTQISAAAAPAGTPAAEEQRLYGHGSLISPDQANVIVSHFKEAYAKLGSPRMLFYVNRELVDNDSGLRLTGRKERVEGTHTETKSDMTPTGSSGTSTQPQVNVSIGGDAGSGTGSMGKGTTDRKTETVIAENTYTRKDGTKGTLADRQTVRDIERLFGRPLRVAGVRLADQRVASSLLEDKTFDHFSPAAATDQASKDRMALSKVADVSIEILISSRQAVVHEVSGDRYVTVPDIQATAIRLSDAQIIGQATAGDILGKDQQAGRLARQFDVKDIAEATALALMEDISGTAH